MRERSSSRAGFTLAPLLTACRQNHLARARDPGEELVGRAVQSLAVAAVEFIRSMPILVLVLVVFTLPYPLTGLRLPGVLLAVAAFGL